MNKKHITYYPLSELSDKIMVGIASAATHAYRESGIPMLRNLNVKEGFIDTSDILYLDQKYELQHKNKRLKSGDVITVRTGYPGQSAVVTSEFEGHQCFTCLVTRPKIDKLDSHYLCFYINSPVGKKFMGSAEAGGAQKNVNASVLARMPIPLISLLEQRKIVEILKEWDSAIALTEKLITAKRRLKQELIQKLITGKVRFPEFSHVDWIDCNLGDLGKCCAGGTPDTGESSYWDGGIHWCTPTDITALKTPFISSTNRTISNLGLAKSSAELLPINSVIVCTRATLGNCAINTVPMATNQGFKSIVPHEQVNTMFLYYLILSLKYEMQRRASGSTFMEISKRLFQTIPIRVPTLLSEQQKIAEALLEFDHHIEYLQKTQQLFKTQKQGLMQQLLTGKIRVQTP